MSSTAWKPESLVDPELDVPLDFVAEHVVGIVVEEAADVEAVAGIVDAVVGIVDAVAGIVDAVAGIVDAVAGVGVVEEVAGVVPEKEVSGTVVASPAPGGPEDCSVGADAVVIDSVAPGNPVCTVRSGREASLVVEGVGSQAVVSKMQSATSLPFVMSEDMSSEGQSTAVSSVRYCEQRSLQASSSFNASRHSLSTFVSQ